VVNLTINLYGAQVVLLTPSAPYYTVKSVKTPTKIRVDITTRAALLELGKKGESYDVVIRRLVEYWVLEEETLTRGAEILDLLIGKEVK